MHKDNVIYIFMTSVQEFQKFLKVFLQVADGFYYIWRVV